MRLSIIQLFFDFGLLILIWIVQLIIYPSFDYFTKSELIKWHHKYTSRISVIVMPLMISQLGSTILQLSNVQSYKTIISIILIGIVWMSTFLQFVPMHNQISKHKVTDTLLHKLTRLNWIRTFLWTIIFLWNLSDLF